MHTRWKEEGRLRHQLTQIYLGTCLGILRIHDIRKQVFSSLLALRQTLLHHPLEQEIILHPKRIELGEEKLQAKPLDHRRLYVDIVLVARAQESRKHEPVRVVSLCVQRVSESESADDVYAETFAQVGHIDGIRCSASLEELLEEDVDVLQK